MYSTLLYEIIYFFSISMIFCAVIAKFSLEAFININLSLISITLAAVEIRLTLFWAGCFDGKLDSLLTRY